MLFEKNMSLEVLAEQQRLQQTTSLFNAELINKYSKYVKTIGKRVVEGLLNNHMNSNEFCFLLVEFCWFQANPCQSFRLRMTEKQFIEAQKYIRSKSMFRKKKDF
jgi:hypothetical protein